MTHELTHLDLFSGIGGFALAASWAGFRTAGFSEVEPHACRVLDRLWPGVPNIGDARITANFTRFRGVTVLTGGFPCQPWSAAGKRGGAGDDRHLWPAMLRVIETVRPTWIIGENVPGLDHLGQLDACIDDLAGIGYESQPFEIPACAVDAPTSGTESGLLPTATAIQSRNCTSGRSNPDSKHHDGMTLNDYVRLWPTPRTNTGPSLDAKHLSLDGAVRLWPTPTKEGFDAGGHRGSSDTLYSAVGGSLNPEWVEWLMGYPIGHTDLKDSATPSSRKSRRRSSNGSPKSKPMNSPNNPAATRAADPSPQ